MTMKQWTEIRFVRGFSEFRSAWSNNAAVFLAPGEEMNIKSDYAQTNMPVKHIRRFIRVCAPYTHVTFFTGIEPD